MPSSLNIPITNLQLTGACGIVSGASFTAAAGSTVDLSLGTIILPGANSIARVTRANEAARYALTTASVQNGDYVYQTDTTTLYEVTDQTNLANANGYTALATVSVGQITGLGSGVSEALGNGVNGSGGLVKYDGDAGVLGVTTLNGNIITAGDSTLTLGSGGPCVVDFNDDFTTHGPVTFASLSGGDSVTIRYTVNFTDVTLPASGTLLSNADAVTGSGSLVRDTSPTLTTPTTNNLTLTGNISSAAWTTSGIRIKGVASTFTDTTSSGTVATAYTSVLGGNTIAASAATTFTNYAALYVAAPVAGANVTLTNGWSIMADNLKLTGTTDSGNTAAGSLVTAGGVGVAKSITLGGILILPATTSSAVGRIQQNGVNLIHTYNASNIFIGESSGNFTLTGNHNVGVGRFTGTSLTSGGLNVLASYEAGNALTTGGNNILLGYRAGRLITTTGSNIALGSYALSDSGTGATDNMAIGEQALRYTTGNQSVAVGVYSLNNATGGPNTAIGWASLNTITTGTYNLCIGHSAGRSLVGGASQNTFLGGAAGYNGSQSTGVSNSIAIGYNTFTTASNQVVLGNSSITSTILRGAVTSGTAGISYTNIRHGVSGAMTAGVVTVTDTACTASTRYMFATHTIGTITLPATYYASTRTASTSFVITSSMITDTSTVDWIAFEP